MIPSKKQLEDPYVQLARDTIEEYVCTDSIRKVPEGLPQEMYETQAGVFVSIKIRDGRHGDSGQTLRLRGCIGTIAAVQSCVAEEIIQNAVSASTLDPRFSPITQAELDQLTISVDVLGSMEKISGLDQLDVRRYGVVVTKGYRRGLLLPNLEGVDTVSDQVAIAKRKAGIGEAESVELERFEVVRHE